MSALQAFPAAWGNAEQGGDYVEGMNLRDWFAGQVINGLISGPDEALEIEAGETVKEAMVRYWLTEAKMAYLIADAMLAAREGGAS